LDVANGPKIIIMASSAESGAPSAIKARTFPSAKIESKVSMFFLLKKTSFAIKTPFNRLSGNDLE
jgi:hypothetical protein